MQKIGPQKNLFNSNGANFIIWGNLPIQDTGYDFSSVMFVWNQKIRQFPVKYSGSVVKTKI